MKKWVVVVVRLDELEYTLNNLEKTYAIVTPPIITYVDQSRIIIACKYVETT